MAEYTGPATTNEADVIASNEGHKVPDTFATGDPTDTRHGNASKFGTAHPKRIHNDIRQRYGRDEPEGYNC